MEKLVTDLAIWATPVGVIPLLLYLTLGAGRGDTWNKAIQSCFAAGILEEKPFPPHQVCCCFNRKRHDETEGMGLEASITCGFRS